MLIFSEYAGSCTNMYTHNNNSHLMKAIKSLKTAASNAPIFKVILIQVLTDSIHLFKIPLFPKLCVYFAVI